MVVKGLNLKTNDKMIKSRGQNIRLKKKGFLHHHSLINLFHSKTLEL